MPFQYQIFPQLNFATGSFFGAISGQEILSVGQQLILDPNWENGFRVLFDYSDVTNINIDSSDIRRIVAQDQTNLSAFNHCRIAVVAPHDLVFGMARMWELLSENNNLTAAIFRDSLSAMAWLTETSPIP